MTALNPYPEYKGSGVEWVDKIPREWATHKLGNLFDLQRRTVSPDDEIVTAFRDGQVTLRSKRRVDGFTEADKEIGYQGIRAGDLVIHNMDAFAGAIGVSDSNGKSTPVYSAATPRRGHDAAYFAYLLRHLALTGFITALARGIRERSTDFRWASAREVLLPVPSREEQRSIVSFVARETAEIDAFIADQEELIRLLTERRAATVTHFLNSATATDKLKLSWAFQFLNGDRGSSYPDRSEFVSVGIPFINAGHLSAGKVQMEEMNFITPEKYASMGGAKLRSGDILYCLRGSVGKNAVFEGGHGALASSLVALRNTSDTVSTRYAYWLLNSAWEEQQRTLMLSGSAQPNLSVESLAQMVFAVPSLSEQAAVADAVELETAAIGAATKDAREAIALSRERRAALISAAVTGKIDVREHAHSGVA